jgi:hypothetical protein
MLKPSNNWIHGASKREGHKALRIHYYLLFIIYYLLFNSY